MMRRSLRFGAGVFLAAGIVTIAADASAAVCPSRPTDAAGYQGYTYGAATVMSFATGRVRVHYATSGVHVPDLATTRGDSVPDTVALAADVGEKSLLKYAEMGFKEPPSDESCTSNGGDNKLDVYLVGFAGADGTTVPVACTGRTCGSFVLVESSFSGRGYPSIAEGFQTVVSHEIFHAIQNGYDSEIDRFWAEGTAQWAMKSVFPAAVDFERQLPAFFKDNTRSLDTQPSGVTAGFLYGSSVWPLFLTLRHGPDAVREILEKQLDGTKAIPATEAMLVSKGSSLAQEYPLFGAFNAATKSLVPEGGYPDAAKYPGVKIVALAEGAAGISSGLSYFPYRGTLDGPSKISLETDAARNAGIVVPIVDGKAKLASAQPLPANAEGEVLVIVAGTTTKKTDAPFTVHVGAADPTLSPDAGGGGGTSGSSGTGGGDDGGGCATTRASSSSRDPHAFFAFVIALAGLFIVGRSSSKRGGR
jgi:hypothetical protein